MYMWKPLTGELPWEGVGQIRVGLYLLDVNVNEDLASMAGPAAARRFTMLAPTLVIHCQGEDDARLLAEDLGADEADPEHDRAPLHVWRSERASIRLVENVLSVHFRQSERTGLAFSAADRWCHFLRMTCCLGVGVVSPSKIYVATLSDREPNTPATVALHPGSTRSPMIENVILHSSKWEAAIPFGARPLAGDNPFHELGYVYYAFESEEFLPGPFERDCILCGSDGPMSSEHCVPRWLVDRLGVTPVVASILCPQCNNKLGSNLEQRIAEAYLSNKMEDASHHSDVAYWVLKTSVMLAAAGNSDIPAEVIEALRTRKIDDSFGLYWNQYNHDRSEERYYRFAVLHLSKGLTKGGHYLSIFETNGFAFCVVRFPGLPQVSIPLLAMQHPRHEAALDLPEQTDIRSYLLERIGIVFDVHTPADGRRHSPRTSRGS